MMMFPSIAWIDRTKQYLTALCSNNSFRASSAENIRPAVMAGLMFSADEARKLLFEHNAVRYCFVLSIQAIEGNIIIGSFYL